MALSSVSVGLFILFHIIIRTDYKSFIKQIYGHANHCLIPWLQSFIYCRNVQTLTSIRSICYSSLQKHLGLAILFGTGRRFSISHYIGIESSRLLCHIGSITALFTIPGLLITTRGLTAQQGLSLSSLRHYKLLVHFQQRQRVLLKSSREQNLILQCLNYLLFFLLLEVFQCLVTASPNPIPLYIQISASFSALSLLFIQFSLILLQPPSFLQQCQAIFIRL